MMRVNQVDTKTNFKAGLGYWNSVPVRYTGLITDSMGDFIKSTKSSKLSVLLEEVNKDGLIKKLPIFKNITEKGKKASMKFRLMSRYILKEPINVKSKTLGADLATAYKEALLGTFPKKTVRNPLIGFGENAFCQN